MMQAQILLLECLDSIQRMTGAESAAALLHMEPPERDSMVLTLPASGRVVTEFRDERSAWDFISSRLTGEAREPTQPVVRIRSVDADGTLVGVSFDRILARPSGDVRKAKFEASRAASGYTHRKSN